MKQLDENSLKFLQDKPDWYKAGYKTGYEHGYSRGQYSDKGMYIAGASIICNIFLIAIFLYFVL